LTLKIIKDGLDAINNIAHRDAFCSVWVRQAGLL
jgi:hypothetical protein